MGDRCYMHITCRREDRELFQLIGFHVQSDQTPDSAIIEMVDEEANYAHADEMPTNVPYYGHHGSGGNYGQHSLACDGRRSAEVETGFDGGFVVVWDTTRNRPTPESLRAVRRYRHVRKKVQNLFQTLTPKPSTQPPTTKGPT